MTIKRLLAPLVAAGFLAGTALAGNAQISGYPAFSGYYGGYGGYGNGYGTGYGYSGNFGAAYGAPVLSYGYGYPGSVTIQPNRISSYGPYGPMGAYAPSGPMNAYGTYGYNTYGNYAPYPVAPDDYNARNYPPDVYNAGNYPVTAANAERAALARARAANSVPRTNDTIQAHRLAGNRTQLSWQGDPQLVNQITFALLDQSYNPVKQKVVTSMPAQATFTKTKKAVYYGVFVQYLNGAENTVISPL